MTTVSRPAPPTLELGGRAVPFGLLAVGTVLTCNGLVLGSQLLVDSRDYSEVATTGLHLAHYVVWTLCLVVLSQLYPRLQVLRGSGGSTIPAWALTFAAVGAVLDACARFVSAFVTPYLAQVQPALVDEAPEPILLVPLLATGVVAMAGTVSVAVTAWRRRVFPRPAAALLALGAVAIPVLGPVSNVLLGLALAWVGYATLPRRRP